MTTDVEHRLLYTMPDLETVHLSRGRTSTFDGTWILSLRMTAEIREYKFCVNNVYSSNS